MEPRAPTPGAAGREESDATLTLPGGAESGGPGADVLARLAGRASSYGRYKLGAEVGRGGMGEVLRVWDEDLRRDLAMKVIRDRPTSGGSSAIYDQRTLGRFLEEAQVTGQLDHPGIVPVHELGLDPDGRLYFTMKLVKGRTLTEVFTLVGSGAEGWTRARALTVIQKVCEAVAYAHDKGVIHRDLKPANVMVGRFGEVYVMDWGLARVIGRRDTHDLRLARPASTVLATDRAELRHSDPDTPLVTLDGTVVGTPSYMPPEQARGEVESLDERSDVYSLGAILYHLLAGHAPYAEPGAERTPRAVLARVTSEAPRAIAELVGDLPAELEAICHKAMARGREQRYASTVELAEDLRAFLEGRVVRAYRTGPLVELRKWVSRNLAVAATAAAAGAVMLVGSLAAALVLAGKNRALVAAGSELERQGYENVIAAADGALSAGDTEAARRFLEQADVARHGWEWLFLAGRTDQSAYTLYRHTEPVRCIATDGTRIATYGSDDQVTLWSSLADRRPRRVPIPDPGWPHQVAFDAGLAQAAAARQEGSGWLVDVWDLGRGERVRTLGGFGAKVIACFASDGRLAAGAEHLSVFAPGASEAELVVDELPGSVAALTFSPDGAWLAAVHRGDARGTLARWDAQTGELAYARNDPPCGSQLAISHDGLLIATSSLHDSIQLFDARTGAPLQRFSGHTNRLTTLAFHPDGRLLVSAARDGTLRVWDVTSERAVTTLLGHDDPCYATFTPDGTRILSASHDGRVKVWDTPPVHATIPAQKQTGAFYMFGTPDGSRVAVRSFDGEVAFWDLARGARLAGISLPGGEIYRQGALSPDGKVFAATLAYGAIGLWEFESGAALGVLEGHDGPVFQLAWHPRGGLLASAAVDGSARLWSFPGRECVRVLTGHTAPVRSVAFDKDGARLVTGGDDGAAWIWDVASGARVGGVADAGGAVWHALLLLGGERLAAVTSAGAPRYELSLWDLTAQPATRRSLAIQEGWLRPLLHPSLDDRRFVLGNIVAPRIPLYDARTGTRLLELRGEIGENFGVVSFQAAGGERLLAHNDRGELIAFDAAPGRVFASRMALRAESAPLVEGLFAEELHKTRVFERLCLDLELEDEVRRAALERVLADPRDRRSVVLALEHALTEAGTPAADAVRRAERLAELEPAAADAVRLQGYARLRSGNPAAGLEALARARELAGRDHPTAAAFEALAHLDLGQRAPAEGALERARELLRNGWNTLYVGAHAVLREAEQRLSTR